MWVFYACLSALFAAATAILGKVGIQGISSNLATAIRTIFVLAMAWGMVFITGSQAGIKEIGGKSLLFLALSGIATGASWLCYYCLLYTSGRGSGTILYDLEFVMTAPAGALVSID